MMRGNITRTVQTSAFGKTRECVASFEQIYFDNSRLHRTVSVRTVEAIKADHIRVEFGQSNDRIEVVLENLCFLTSVQEQM